MGRSEDQQNGQGGSGSRRKSKSGSKPAKPEDKEAAERQRKAQLECKIRERVALEARAFDVVNRLIEPNITTEYLLQACQFIDQNHYEDIVEERTISHLCGYPLCNNALHQVAKKKYHINTKSNTVYDITERKKFCSNSCYRCSEHLRKQIPQTAVWTGRGEDMPTFDLLQHHNSRSLEGETVIGSHMLGLKEEVQFLEKLDKMEMKAEGKARKAGPAAQRGPASLEESQRLSRQLLSLSTEEDLGRGMEKLSLHADPGGRDPSDGNEPAPSSSAPSSGSRLNNSSSSKDVEREGKTQEGYAGAGTHNEKQNDPGEKAEKAVSADGKSGLESSMKGLTLQDSGDGSGMDSDDDCAENHVSGDTGVSGKNQLSGAIRETPESSVSKPHPARHCPAVLDSDDDEEEEDTCDSNVSVGRMIESDNLSKPRDSGGSERCTDSSSHPVGTDRKSADTESVAEEERPKENVLKQQPGESKTAYLMRLLDKHKNLLSKFADIQPSVSLSSEKTESKPDGSAHDSGIDNKADKTKSVESDRRESVGEENEHHRGASEQPKQGKESRVDPEASHLSRKKKNTQAYGKSSTKSRAQPKASPLSAICQVISTWVSAETLDYLGISSASSKGSEEEDRDTSTSKFMKDPEMQKKYQDLCQRLAGQEKDFDAMLGEDDLEADGGDRQGGRKPLPNYEELKKQTEEHQLKVQQFMAGSMTIKSKPTKAKAEAEEDGEKVENERPIVLPVIDSCNQLLIRRRIVLQFLAKTMPTVLPPLGLSIQHISTYLRELVFTFSLTSRNITFRPAEWTLVAIILLKMMETKCAEVATAFQSPARSSAFNMVLSRLDPSSASLDQLVEGMLTQHSQALQAAGGTAGHPETTH